VATVVRKAADKHVSPWRVKVKHEGISEKPVEGNTDGFFDCSLFKVRASPNVLYE